MEKLFFDIYKYSPACFLPTICCGLFLVLIISCSCKNMNSILYELGPKKKFNKRETIFLRVDFSTELFILAYVTIIIISAIIYENAKYSVHINDLLEKIEVIGTLVMGLTTIAVTLSVAVILFDKQYYILFSIREVLWKYKIPEHLIIVLTSSVFAYITEIALINQEIDSFINAGMLVLFELAVIYNILFSIRFLFPCSIIICNRCLYSRSILV